MNRGQSLRLLIALLVAGPAASQQLKKLPSNDASIVHLLNRFGYGARPQDIAAIKSQGVDRWLDDQLHPDRVKDTVVDNRLASFTALTMSIQEFQKAAPPNAQAQVQAKRGATATMSPADSAMTVAAQRMAAVQTRSLYTQLPASRLIRASMSERPVEESLDDFWTNHFNVYDRKNQQMNYYLPEYDREVIRPNIFGTFRDMLGAVAHSPAMLLYLDNSQSIADSMAPTLAPIARLSANQVAARLQAQNPNQPLAQAVAARRPSGLNENYARELMELHTLGVDGGYTQKDVQEVARALTGWTIDRPALGGKFIFRPISHDAGSKMILGKRFPAGQGESEGNEVLDMLASHPSTAHFIATKLVRRYVSDDPSPALVNRVAETFTRSKGDLRETLKTIIYSPEFWAAGDSKVKMPVEFVASALRLTGAVIDSQPRGAMQSLTSMGEAYYGAQPPTGYPDKRDLWLNTDAISQRVTFAQRLSVNRMPGVSFDIRAFYAGASTPEERVDRTLSRLLPATNAANLRTALLEQAKKSPANAELVALALSSPEFQRR